MGTRPRKKILDRTAFIMDNLGNVGGMTPPDSSALIKDTDMANFMADVIEASNETPVIVDFWAPWCGPCKMIAPILDELAGDYADRLAIVKMNVDEQPDTAAKYNVRGIPTLLIFKDGELASTHVGLISKSDLVAFINKQL